MYYRYLPLLSVRQSFRDLSQNNYTRLAIRRHPDLRHFINYMNRNYIREESVFPPALWNVFGRNMDNRTNNHVECKNLMRI